LPFQTWFSCVYSLSIKHAIYINLLAYYAKGTKSGKKPSFWFWASDFKNQFSLSLTVLFALSINLNIFAFKKVLESSIELIVVRSTHCIFLKMFYRTEFTFFGFSYLFKKYKGKNRFRSPRTNGFSIGFISSSY